MLRAVQVIVDELANPILVGRPAVLAHRIERFGLRLREGNRLHRRQSENDRVSAGIPSPTTG